MVTAAHEIKRHLLLGRKSKTKLDSLLKNRDITLPTKACLVKAMIHPAVMYGCESWPSLVVLVVKISSARHKRQGFDLWVGNIPWRRIWQSTAVFLPGQPHGQRNLVGYIQSMESQRVRHGWVTPYFPVPASDFHCLYSIKRHLPLGRRAMANLDSVLKSRDITLPTKINKVKTIIFPVVMCGCESWILKDEHQRIDAFQLQCWRRLLIAPWVARRSNQSILMEINPEYSLEGLMLKL